MGISKSKWAIALFVSLLLVATNCSSLLLKEKLHFFAWEISKGQLREIKQTIIDAGYKQITEDDCYYEGAYDTQYKKEIFDPVGKKNNIFIVLISFKTDDLSSGAYRNFAFNLYAQGDNTEEEKNTMEKTIYNKLVGFSGKENVERR